jgi:hypothetical protein
MKSDHRHELKTNELAEWIANLPQWARENGKMVVSVSIVAVLVVGSALWYWRKTKVESVQEQFEFTKLIARLPQNKMQVLMAQSRGVDTSYTFIETAVALQTAAESATDGKMAALAFIKQAESLRAGLHYRQETVNQSDLRTAIDGAKAAYLKAIDKAVDNPPLLAMARFGLGLCEEEIGNFSGAEQIYRDIVANDDFEGTTVIAKAEQRLETMADYQKNVVFRPAPKPKPMTPEFMQPPIPLRPIDVNVGPQGPNRVPMLPGLQMGPEPNRTFVIPEVKMEPEPNGVPEPININLRPQTPNSVVGGADTNVPG